MRIHLLSIILVVVFFSSCAYRYAPRNLQIDNEIKYSYKSEKNNVSVSFNAISFYSNQGYFKKYIPVKVQVLNNSNKSYILDSEKIELDLVNFNELKRNIPAIFFSYFITSTSFLLISALFLPFAPLWGELCLLFSAGKAALGVFSGYKHKKRNQKRLRKVFLGPNQRIKIGPHSLFEKIFFVSRKKYRPHFDFVLSNSEENLHLKFDVLIVAKKRHLACNLS